MSTYPLEIVFYFIISLQLSVFDYAAIGIYEEFELSLALFGKLMPNFFGIANDLAYGQRNVGLRRFDIMNQLYSQKVQKSKTVHPAPHEWQEYELQFMSKWFSYEMDAYAFARKLFWQKITALNVARYIPADDTSDKLQTGQDLGSVSVL